MTRDGSGSRAVIAAVATASVGETIAPSANAAASGSDGISQCIDVADADDGDEHEPEREQQHRSQITLDEIALRDQPAVGEQRAAG